MDEIGVHARASIDTDRAIKALGRVAGVFKRLPCTLKEMPVLRIHDRSVSWTQAEERSIKHGDVVEHRCSLDVVRARQLFLRNARVEQFSVGTGANRLDAIVQVSPELGDVAGTGKAPCHANDCD